VLPRLEGKGYTEKGKKPADFFSMSAGGEESARQKKGVPAMSRKKKKKEGRWGLLSDKRAEGKTTQKKACGRNDRNHRWKVFINH